MMGSCHRDRTHRRASYDNFDSETLRKKTGGRLRVEIMVLLILLGVALVDGKLWKVVLEQRRHNKAVEQLLAEIRDRSGRSGV
jgi:hypothetical protein